MQKLAGTFQENPEAPALRHLPESQTSRKLRTRVARRGDARVSRDALADRAQILPEPDRSIATAYYRLGMSVESIAAIRQASPGQIRRRLESLRDMLSDPSFLLAAKYAPLLPPDLAPLARAYWVEARTLRQLASSQNQTLHAIRQRLAQARSHMLVLMTRETAAGPPRRFQSE